MTDTERKALALLNEICVEMGLDKVRSLELDMPGERALLRAIEQHEAFRQEVSDAVEALLEMPRCDPDEIDLVAEYLDCFIIAKTDPLVEAVTDVWPASCDEHVNELRAAIEKRGGKIVWGEEQ